MDWTLFGSTFVLVFVAELPDKTAFASLLLATRHHPFAVFLGAAGAFVIQSAVAVLFGSLLGMLPAGYVRTGAGVLFLCFALAMWLRKGEAEASGSEGDVRARSRFLKSVSTSFLAIFIAEWGDLTQLATAALAAKYRAPVTIFVSATLALWAVTAIGVLIGHHARRLIEPLLLQRIAAVAFAMVGILLLINR